MNMNIDDMVSNHRIIKNICSTKMQLSKVKIKNSVKTAKEHTNQVIMRDAVKDVRIE